VPASIEEAGTRVYRQTTLQFSKILLKHKTHSQPHIDGISRGEVDLRDRFYFVLQARFRVELRFAPSRIQHVLDAQIEPPDPSAIDAIEINHGIASSRDATILVGRSVANMAVAQAAFQARGMTPCQAASRGQVGASGISLAPSGSFTASP